MSGVTDKTSGRPSPTVVLVTRLVRSVLLIVAVWAAAMASLWLLADRARTQTATAASEDLFATVLARETQRMLQIAMDYAWWDDSIQQVLVDLDPDWADNNLGGYLNEGFSVDYSVVLDGTGTAFYGARDGERLVEPTAEALGTGFPALRAAALAARRQPMPKGAAGLVMLDGVPAVTAVMPFTPEEEDSPASPDPDAVLVVARALDAEWLAELGGAFRLEDLRLGPAGAAPDDGAMLTLQTPEGAPLATALWQPAVPGGRLDTVVLGTMAALSLVMLVLLAVFMTRAGRLSRRIAADDEDRLRQAEALARSEQRLRLVVAGAPVALLVTDSQGRVVLAEGREAFHVAPPDGAAVIGRPLADAYGHLHGLPELVEQVSHGGGAVATVGSETREFEAACAPVPGAAAGGPAGVVAVLTDVTERRAAEEALRRTLDELSRSNQELERFAYVASHDLQEPVRSMVAYAQLTQRRYADALDDDGREFLRYIEQGALRMRDLVHGLLAYSRLGGAGRAAGTASCDARAALDMAVDNLAGTIGEAGARIEVDALPKLAVGETELTQLFQNLVSNSLKFRRPDRPPTIRVTAAPAGTTGMWTLTVQDDGIGIAPEYLDDVFILFKRLHGPSRFPGTGVGLAICQRIVERHGGRIWVTSQAGSGSAFHFTLPSASRAVADKGDDDAMTEEAARV